LLQVVLGAKVSRQTDLGLVGEIHQKVDIAGLRIEVISTSR
jgi:hypothetical protein